MPCENAKWIRPVTDLGDIVPKFGLTFTVKSGIEKAELSITGLGTYIAKINGQRTGNFILAPGWTSYGHRLQVQTYDVTALLKEENQIEVLLGKGWYRSRLVGWETSPAQEALRANPAGLLAELTVVYQDGSKEVIVTDENWQVTESKVRFSEIYDGEIYDATVAETYKFPVEVFDGPTHTLIPQEGPEVHELEHLSVQQIITTPAGETVLDFGQEITGYVQVCVNAKAGETVDLSFGEVLDQQGNFYNANYRSAKCQYHYTCADGEQTWHPQLTFYGFRYVKVNEFPGGPQQADKSRFTAIVVQSDLKRIGHLETSDSMLNHLISNAVWSQKCNFVDVPTDCPQRDERLGWTGDAQVFSKTACYNYDAEQFFYKWLGDLAADQREDGAVGFVIPDLLRAELPSAAWGDVATVCPWEVYLAYGNPEILSRQFDSMTKWVDYITSATTKQYLWTGGEHFADWLGLDAPVGSYKGSTREDFIASAYYAYSTELVIKAGKVLGKDVSAYEALYEKIVEAFRKEYPDYRTQTECVLAVHFGLAADPQAAADQLAKMIVDAGTKLQTGFVGTPYLMHALSKCGHTQLAYDLLFRKEYPSWLYPVTKGATTIWEHWDGIMENGDFWSTDMNSFNHYAYGAVLDWLYGVAAGVKTDEAHAGYGRAVIAPHPDQRLGWLEARLDTRNGQIISRWEKDGAYSRYEITTPVEADITIDGKTRTVPAGSYIFFGE